MRAGLPLSLLVALILPTVVVPADDPLGDNAALQYWRALTLRVGGGK